MELKTLLGLKKKNTKQNEWKATMEKRVIPWFKDNGDKTLRLNYDINENSVVFDMGGYHGDWAVDIFCKYSCKIYIFEPVQKFADMIKNRFSHNDKINVYSFGLAGQDDETEILLDEDSSSVVNTLIEPENKEKIKLIEAAKFLKEASIENIDLMKINIEGGEYDLLEHLINTGFISKIRNIQVQFHEYFPGAEARMKNIQQKLMETHHLTYQYKFVWENWTLNN